MGGLPGAVGGHRTCTAVPVPRSVQRGADVQIELLSLEHRVMLEMEGQIGDDRVNVAQCAGCDLASELPLQRKGLSQVVTALQGQTLSSSQLALQRS